MAGRQEEIKGEECGIGTGAVKADSFIFGFLVF